MRPPAAARGRVFISSRFDLKPGDDYRAQAMPARILVLIFIGFHLLTGPLARAGRTIAVYTQLTRRVQQELIES
jgi:hypothetical protein